jgi:hypothetical protein
MTGGQVYDETEKALEAAVKKNEVFRRSDVTAQSPQPTWFWLVLLTGVGLFFDVAVRRIAVEPAEVSATAVKVWEYFRGRADSTEPTPFMERLQNRKVQVDETIGRAARRFEAEEERPVAPPVATADTATTRRPPAVHSPAPPKLAGAPADDAFARLMKAKKKALGDRDAGPPES